MGLFDSDRFHDRCRDIEAALRGRVSDLEEREERLLQRIADLEEQHRDREQAWVERYTALLNPAAARMMAVNHRITQQPEPAQPAQPAPAQPVRRAEDQGEPAEPLTDPAEPPITPEISYRDRTSPVRPMPVLSPHQTGYRMLHPRRVPINTNIDTASAPAPAPAVVNEPATESMPDAGRGSDVS